MYDAPLWLFGDQLGPHVPRDRRAPPSRARSCSSSRAGVLRRRTLPPPEAAPGALRPAAPGRGAGRARPLPARRDLPRGVDAARPDGAGARATLARGAELVRRLQKEGWWPTCCRRRRSRCRGPSSRSGRASASRSGWRTSTGPSGAGSTCCGRRRAVGGSGLRPREPRAPAKGVSRLDGRIHGSRPRTRSTSGSARPRRDGPADGGPRRAAWFAVTAARPNAPWRTRRAAAAALRPARGRDADEDWAMAHSLLSVRSNLGVLHPLDVVRAARRRSAPATCRAQRGGLHPTGAGLAGVHLAAVLALRQGLPAAQRPGRAAPRYRSGGTELDADAVTAAAAHRPGGRARPRLDPPHPAVMILGNHALQRGYQPRELSEWFREAFVDGFEWVMPPNVIGIEPARDGGLLATKRTARVAPT